MNHRLLPRPILHAATWILLIAVCLLCTTTAHAEVVREQLETNPEPSGQLQIEPGRIERDVEPGVRQVFTIKLTNHSDEAVDVSTFASDLGPAPDPRSVAAQVEDGEFGAGDWLQSEAPDLRIAPFERVSFDVVIDPPIGAPVGTNLGAIIVRGTPAEGPIGTTDADDALFNVDGLIQVFLTVPGPIEHDVRITSIDVRDRYVFGSHRFVVWELTVENRGTVNEHVKGPVQIRSIFGNAAHKIEIPDLIVLRGSTRTHRLVWNDPPWIGSFVPESRLRADDVKVLEATGERVTIFPWWIVVVIVLLIAIPAFLLWLRRRNEWQQYLDDEGDGWESAHLPDDDGAPVP